MFQSTEKIHFLKLHVCIPTFHRMLITLDSSNRVNLQQLRTTETQCGCTELITHTNNAVLIRQWDKWRSSYSSYILLIWCNRENTGKEEEGRAAGLKEQRWRRGWRNKAVLQMVRGKHFLVSFSFYIFFFPGKCNAWLQHFHVLLSALPDDAVVAIIAAEILPR